VSDEPEKTTSLVVAYGRGFKGLALTALGVVGAALAWRLANKIVDWLLGEGKVQK